MASHPSDMYSNTACAPDYTKDCPEQWAHMVGYCQAPATYKVVGIQWQLCVKSVCSYGAAQGACGYLLRTASYTESQKRVRAIAHDRIFGKRLVGMGVSRQSQQRARLLTIGEMSKWTRCVIAFSFPRHLGLAGSCDRYFKRMGAMPPQATFDSLDACSP